jgi:hypothetical protein
VVLTDPPMSHAKQLIRPFTTVARAMQEGLAFRSKENIGVVVRRGARSARDPTAPSA